MTTVQSTAARPRYPLFVGIGAAVMAGVLIGLMLTVAVAPPGVAEPGTVVTVGLPLARALLDLAAATTVGLSLLPELLGADRPNRAAPVQALARSVAVASSAILCLAAVASLVLETADLDVGQPLTIAAIADHVHQIASGRALLYVAGAALGYLVITLLAVPAELRIAVALLALLPLPATGHADSGTSWQDVNIIATELHVVGAVVWTGGLLAVTLLVAADRTLLSFALPRYSRIATACVFLTVVTGMASGWLELYQTPGVQWYIALFTSGYGQLLLLKGVCLTGAALLGAHTRFRLLPRIIHGRATAVAAWATAELAFMGLAFGLAAVLVRAPVMNAS
jgi:putative copper resistance protein D